MRNEHIDGLLDRCSIEFLYSTYLPLTVKLDCLVPHAKLPIVVATVRAAGLSLPTTLTRARLRFPCLLGSFAHAFFPLLVHSLFLH